MRKSMGEREVIRIGASSIHGNGSLYITDRAVSYEVDSRGIYLNFIPYEMIEKFHVLGGMFGAKKFRMVWLENGAKNSFEFRTKQHRKLLGTLKGIRFGRDGTA